MYGHFIGYDTVLRPLPQGSELLSGQLALSTLSNNGLCAVDLLLIFSAATFVLSLPRALGQMNWLGFVSTVAITLCGVLAMIGAGVSPTPGRSLSAAVPTTFYEAFLAITGPVSPRFLARMGRVSSLSHARRYLRMQVSSVLAYFSGSLRTLSL